MNSHDYSGGVEEALQWGRVGMRESRGATQLNWVEGNGKTQLCWGTFNWAEGNGKAHLCMRTLAWPQEGGSNELCMSCTGNGAESSKTWQGD